MISPRCTYDIPPMYSWYPPMYSWYPPHASWYWPPMYWTSPDVLMISPNVLNTPDVLMISLRCTHGIPHMHHDSPRCTEHPPMYSWYPSDVLMVSPDVLKIPRCTHDIPRCTKHPRCTERTLYRVLTRYLDVKSDWYIARFFYIAYSQRFSKAIVMLQGYSDSLAFLLMLSISAKVEPAWKRSLTFS